MNVLSRAHNPTQICSGECEAGIGHNRYLETQASCGSHGRLYRIVRGNAGKDELADRPKVQIPLQSRTGKSISDVLVHDMFAGVRDKYFLELGSCSAWVKPG